MTFELPTLSFTARDKIFGNMSVLTRLQNKAMQRLCNNQFNCKNEQSMYVTGTYRTPAVFKFKCHRMDQHNFPIFQLNKFDKHPIPPTAKGQVDLLTPAGCQQPGTMRYQLYRKSTHGAVLAIKHRLYINTAVQTVAHLRK